LSAHEPSGQLVDEQFHARLSSLEGRMRASEDDRLAIHEEVSSLGASMARVESVVVRNADTIATVREDTENLVATFNEVRIAFRFFVKAAKVLRATLFWAVMPLVVAWSLFRAASGEGGVAAVLEKMVPWLK
jgi:hypothetical protein